MLRSLFSGISGLRTHQQMMDVTGNNIANVNTSGYKTATAVFQDTLSQMLRPAGTPQTGNGGTNPAQIGLGVQLSAISTSFSQGSAQATGRNTDLMINGDGFFVLKNAGEQLYTRAGAFSFDTDGRLVNPAGMVVQGWIAEDGVVDTNALPDTVQLPIGRLFPPIATNGAAFGGNLPADSLNPNPITTAITTFDRQGNEVTLSVTFTKVSSTEWNVSATDGPRTAPAVATTISDTVRFDSTGGTPGLVTAGGTTLRLVRGTADALNDPTDADADIAIDLSLLSSYAGGTTLAPLSQNGSAMGYLTSFTISADGLLVGVFSNGLKQTLAQLAMASFNNPPGLEKVGDSMFRNTVNSGEAALGTAGTGGRGLLQSNALEMSNVDLGQEFTSLIVAQRGFQANSKVITTSDELLQELVNLKR